jgi:hypothetical protein
MPLSLYTEHMSERFFKLLEETLKREHGGPVPRSVELIAQRVGSEMRLVLIKAGLRPDKLTDVEMKVVELSIEAAREVLYRERNGSGCENWYSSGFGNVHQWVLNGRK